MNRCTECVIPDTRPDTHFENGVCAACRAYKARASLDWPTRRGSLQILLETARMRAERRGTAYDCIVPSSGGKDSHYQVLKLIELGARPLVVTASTCHLTTLGRLNITNLAHHATTIEVTANRRVRKRLNRIALEMVGDISWPEHCAIFTTPFRVAIAQQIPLIFYGENPQNQYGGPLGSTEARQMTRRWVTEFGGFLGLRPADIPGMDGLTAHDMADYEMPQEAALVDAGIEAHFLGHYLPWNSHENAGVARDGGMQVRKPMPTSWWDHENLDNAQTGLHDHMMYRKYGYGRVAAQVSVDIRAGLLGRGQGMEIVRANDGAYPHIYADVPDHQMLEAIGLDRHKLRVILDAFTDPSLFRGEVDKRPVLKD